MGRLVEYRERCRSNGPVARGLGAVSMVTPLGYALSKQEYLGSIASGQFRYLIFEAVSDIAVRGGDGFALLRYRARISVDGTGVAGPFTCWHTDSYELRTGRWQAVWSQATRIRPSG
jgi:hypothetical protein